MSTQLHCIESEDSNQPPKTHVRRSSRAGGQAKQSGIQVKQKSLPGDFAPERLIFVLNRRYVFGLLQAIGLRLAIQRYRPHVRFRRCRYVVGIPATAARPGALSRPKPPTTPVSRPPVIIRARPTIGSGTREPASSITKTLSGAARSRGSAGRNRPGRTSRASGNPGYSRTTRR